VKVAIVTRARNENDVPLRDLARSRKSLALTRFITRKRTRVYQARLRIRARMRRAPIRAS